jgi:hypothetical protein
MLRETLTKSCKVSKSFIVRCVVAELSSSSRSLVAEYSYSPRSLVAEALRQSDNDASAALETVMDPSKRAAIALQLALSASTAQPDKAGEVGQEPQEMVVSVMHDSRRRLISPPPTSCL